jgi:hypothetical protein
MEWIDILETTLEPAEMQLCADVLLSPRVTLGCPEQALHAKAR